VSDAANEHRKNLASLDKRLQQISDSPEPVGEDFEMQLRKLQARQRKAHILLQILEDKI